MHPNPVFRKPETATNIAVARRRGFGVLAVNATHGPLISHIPFALSEDGSGVELHLVRSNPILRLLDMPIPAVIAVQGPDSYISPDWYGVDDQVPTWNYVAVHLRGQLEQRPAEELHAMLDRLSGHFEDFLRPKPPWITGKMSAGVMEKMMRMIVPCHLHVSDINGTWKLNQNKDEAVRLAAADAVERDGIGTSLQELAALMRRPEV